ncbi:Uncharacterized protein HZ326_11179 [Fusarium oxysporum f. sp. albedinis]|nr:Uncharacterized protein HZ326_11179 [Fusarium oxysporum f. sp. albedinis]
MSLNDRGGRACHAPQIVLGLLFACDYSPPALYGHCHAEERPLRLGVGGKWLTPVPTPPASRTEIWRTDTGRLRPDTKLVWVTYALTRCLLCKIVHIQRHRPVV